ncbi:MAG: hypothetical protein AAFX02_07795 [Pseudomonadota bacterium]
MKKTLSALAILGALSALNACNTVAGIGEDITSASEAVQERISDEDETPRNNRNAPQAANDELLGGPGDGGL